MDDKQKKLTKKRSKAEADSQASTAKPIKHQTGDNAEKKDNSPKDDYQKGGIAQLLASSNEESKNMEATVTELFDPTRAEGLELETADPRIDDDMSGSNDSNSDNDLTHQQSKELLSQQRAETAQKTQDELEEQSRRTVFIGNLPPKVNREDVLNLVKEFGEVESLRLRGMLICSKDDKKPIGVQAILKFKKKDLMKACSSIASIVFKTEKEGRRAAYTLNNTKYDDRTIRAKLASKETKVNPNSSVFVGNVPQDASEDDIRSVFVECGEIDDVRLPVNERNGQRCRFAFVQFKKSDSVSLALQLSNVSLSGRTLRICRRKSEQAMQNAADDEPTKKKDDGWSNRKNNQIFIRHIPKNATEDQIKSIFEEFGEVEKVELVKREMGASFGFIQFMNVADAERAMNKRTVNYEDQKLLIFKCFRKPSIRGPSKSAMQNAADGSKKNKRKNRDGNDDEPTKKKEDGWSNRENNQIFIRHIPKNATEDQIKSRFEEFGEVEKVELVKREKVSLGFIQFMNVADAERAISKHTVNYEDQKLLIFKCFRIPSF